MNLNSFYFTALGASRGRGKNDFSLSVFHCRCTATDGKASTRLDKEAFVSACTRLLGDGPRKVVIKLMRDKVRAKKPVAEGEGGAREFWAARTFWLLCFQLCNVLRLVCEM